MSRLFYLETIRKVREKIAEDDLHGAADLLHKELLFWQNEMSEHQRALVELIQAVKAYEAHIVGAVRWLMEAKNQLPDLRENNLNNVEFQLQYITQYGKSIVEAAERITELCKKDELG